MKTASFLPKKNLAQQELANHASEGIANFKDNRPDTRLAQMKAIVQNNDRLTAQRFAYKDALGYRGEIIDSESSHTGLPDNLRMGVENLSGFDLSDVKVHYNSSKPAQLQALAYAQDNNIYLGQGQEKHLAHEAWHIVQQKQNRVFPTSQVKGGMLINDDMNMEKEADIMGAKAIRGSADHFTGDFKSGLVDSGGTGLVQKKTSGGVIQRLVNFDNNFQATHTNWANLQTQLFNSFDATTRAFFNFLSVDLNTHLNIELWQRLGGATAGSTTVVADLGNGKDLDLLGIKNTSKKLRKQLQQNSPITFTVAVGLDKNENIGRVYATLMHELLVHVLPWRRFIAALRNGLIPPNDFIDAVIEHSQKGKKLNGTTQHQRYGAGKNNYVANASAALAARLRALASRQPGLRDSYNGQSLPLDTVAKLFENELKKDISDHHEMYS